MSYLVTGGLGFIGARIVRQLLDAGKPVVCADLARDSVPARRVIGDRFDALTRISLNVSDTMAVFDVVKRHDVEVLVHTAFAMEAAETDPTAPASHLGSARAGREMAGETNLHHAMAVNCGGMLNMLEAARLFGLRKVVFTGAVAAFGTAIGAVHDTPIGDDGVFKPDTMYGATKVMNEVMAKIYRDRHGVDSIGLRFARTYGVGNPAPFTQFIKMIALEGGPVRLADPDYFNSYVSVEDCAAAHVVACEAKTTQGVFNIREGEYSNAALRDILLQLMPDAMIDLVAGPSDGVPVPRLTADGAASDLGWSPRDSLATGLKRMMDQFRADAALSAAP